MEEGEEEWVMEEGDDEEDIVGWLQLVVETEEVRGLSAEEAGDGHRCTHCLGRLEGEEGEVRCAGRDSSPNWVDLIVSWYGLRGRSEIDHAISALSTPARAELVEYSEGKPWGSVVSQMGAVGRRRIADGVRSAGTDVLARRRVPSLLYRADPTDLAPIYALARGSVAYTSHAAREFLVELLVDQASAAVTLARGRALSMEDRLGDVMVAFERRLASPPPAHPPHCRSPGVGATCPAAPLPHPRLAP
jgi:hypothetical protein